MCYKFFKIFGFLLSTFYLSAQSTNVSFQTVENNDIEHLIKEVFLKGNCKNVSNIQWSGEPVSFGEFKQAGNVLGVQEGIILSSGDVKLAEGPNDNVEATASFGNNRNDKDLATIATNQLFDVTYIEFDFVPLADQVSFQYVFASEEYCEFVGTIFNDVFGFFVSGPGINGEFSDGAINVATLSNSEEFVSINTVNHESNSENYVKNELEIDARNCGITFSPNYVEDIQFDGFTIPLTARFSVIPCETYHIRLVVGDVGDDKLDSAVFLRSKSFDIGSLATVEAEVPNRTEAIVYENCIDGQFIFTRPKDADKNIDYPVNFILSENGTALEGIDFQVINRSITIPAGSNQVILPITSLVDEERENTENLIIELEQTCDCEEGNTATLQIRDALPPTSIIPRVNACIDQSFILKPIITGGVSPYEYKWSDGSTADTLTTIIQVPTTYYLTVTDFCDNSFEDSILVDIQEQPTAEISGIFEYCEGLPIPNLSIQMTGVAPWSFTYSIDRGISVIVDSILTNVYSLATSTAGIYELSNFSDAACIGTTMGEGEIIDINLVLTHDVTPPICPSQSNGSVFLNIEKGEAPYQINWSTETNSTIQPTNLAVGDYTISIEDNRGCKLLESIEVPPPDFVIPTCENNALYVPNAFSPNGDGQNDNFEVFLAEETTVQQILELQIIDRWGNIVFNSTEDTPKWDGRFQGELLNNGVFFYKILVELINGQTKLLQGDISLIR